MSNFATRPRILFVTPDLAFIPEKGGNRTNFISANPGGFGNFPAELTSALFHFGVDVHVVQPDYRRIFAISAGNEHTKSGIKLPNDRVHFAEDRAFFYSKPINSNCEWENLKMSLVFQREVINQIIPRVQPDLIHCYDWMSGLIPAAAKQSEIPCLFTVQRFDSARSLLACVEDIGIDAAGFWQNLFYDRYPGSYEQTRDTNALDLLLSGILAASHVNTANSILLPKIIEDRSDYSYSPLEQLLAQKWKAGCVCEIPGPPHLCLNPTRNKKLDCSYRPLGHPAGNQKIDRAKRQSISSSDIRIPGKCYIDLYEMILQRPLVTSENKKVHPINKNSGVKTSNARAIPFPKAHSTKSYPLPNERISPPAMAPL